MWNLYFHEWPLAQCTSGKIDSVMAATVSFRGRLWLKAETQVKNAGIEYLSPIYEYANHTRRQYNTCHVPSNFFFNGNSNSIQSKQIPFCISLSLP